MTLDDLKTTIAAYLRGLRWRNLECCDGESVWHAMPALEDAVWHVTRQNGEEYLGALDDVSEARLRAWYEAEADTRWTDMCDDQGDERDRKRRAGRWRL